MLWWRKRNEGFEWRDYVRTTILVRREQRRQRLKGAQEAAVHHVKEAGRRGVEAGVAGARVAGHGAWSSVRSGTIALGHGAVRGATWLAATLGSGAVALLSGGARAVSALGDFARGPLGRLEPLLSALRGTRLGLGLMIAAALAGAGALYRWFNFGLDGDVMFVAALALFMALLVLLAVATDPDRGGFHREAGRDSLLQRLKGGDFALPESSPFSAQQAGVALLALAVLGAGGAGLYYGAPFVAGLVASGPAGPQSPSESADAWKLEGRATALSGDSLRVAGKLVALDGIEAPEASQSCERKSGRWRCGVAAKDALSSLVRGRRVVCDVLGETEGQTRARCYVREADIGETLVRNGHVFATGGFLSRYASVEGEAQDAQRGLWAGAVERPQDYRDKRWEEAKKAAPDGCPIKGRVRAGARTYVLPWSPAYASTRLSTARGERWFCSESEAQAAGWTRSTAS